MTEPTAAPAPPEVAFDPALPCASFDAPLRRRVRRRAPQLRFVEQAGARFVVKSYAEAGDAPEDPSRRVRRELEGIEGFRRAGSSALAPLLGLAADLELVIDGAPVAAAHAMIFPYVGAPTLDEALAAARDPLPLVREAASRIRARHTSDGG